MPPLWPYLLLVVPAVPLVVDDFRLRRVGVLWLVALGSVAVGVGWTLRGLDPMLRSLFWNGLLLMLFLGVMACYHTLRRFSSGSFFRDGFGLGDAVTMLVVTPLFSPAGYVRFLLAGSLAALLWWFLRRATTIPLAGILAAVLGVWSVVKTFGLWT